jgi:hypothetical protein
MLAQQVKADNLLRNYTSFLTTGMINAGNMLIVVLVVITIWLSVVSYLTLIKKPASSSRPLVSSRHFHCHLVRFNPFPDTGGEQSFVISLLDGGGNGILLTSLHGRGVSRLYAKEIKAGKSDQKLSREEAQTLAGTISGFQNEP